MASTGPAVTREVEDAIRPLVRKKLEDIVVEKAKTYAAAANLPDEFVDGIELRERSGGGTVEFDLVNTFKGKFGEPLAEWFEEGTKRFYKIRPKVDHPTFGFGDAQPVLSRGQEAREDDENPRNIYTERDIAHIEHGDDTKRQHPSVLHWFRDGIHHYRKEVTHPGREPVLAMHLAQDAAMEDVRRIVQNIKVDAEGYDVTIDSEWVPGGAS